MRIYFMGICGTAMGNAALLARAAGHAVLGADANVYPPMSDVLRGAGIELLEGYDAARLERLAPELVVIGNAMTRGNAEVEWLLEERRMAFTSLPAMLHEFVLKTRRNIVVGGTHGKTTTTSLAAFLLRENGRDPGFLIGGVPQDPPVGNWLGTAGEPFVIEGDEYDCAFFDKRSKFIHYAPHIAVLNNAEFDHADIFRDLADVQRTFQHLCRIVPRNGCIVLNGDDENLRALGDCAWTRVVRVGTDGKNDVRITNFREGPEGAEFEVSWRGELWARVKWGLPGLFNARNAAMAATAAGLAIAGDGGRKARPTGEANLTAETNPTREANPTAEANPTGLKLDALGKFRGVKRRQEILLATPAVTVIEDFGHHPTAIAETLHSLRARHPGATLTAVFEPRSNTARTKALEAGFMRALALADEAYLGAVNRADKLATGDRFDTEGVAEHLEALGLEAHAAATNALLLEKLVENVLGKPAENRGGGGAASTPRAKARVVVFFTNGDFDGIMRTFVTAARG